MPSLRPYASHTLNTAERNYSQIDREGLALIFAVKKFHKYLAGRHFTLVTDHKPLLGLFGEGKSIPEHASARVQRWAITLSAYSYTLQHRPGRENSADSLSRLPLPYTPDEEDGTYDINCVPEEVNFLFSLVYQVPLSAKDIAKETQKDITLKAVFQCVSSGWPAKSNDKLRAFAARKNELNLEKGFILWVQGLLFHYLYKQKYCICYMMIHMLVLHI